MRGFPLWAHIVVGTVLSGLAVHAQEPTRSPNPYSDPAFERHVIQAILNNPEVVLVALQLVEAQKAEEAKARDRAALAQ